VAVRSEKQYLVHLKGKRHRREMVKREKMRKLIEQEAKNYSEIFQNQNESNAKTLDTEKSSAIAAKHEDCGLAHKTTTGDANDGKTAGFDLGKDADGVPRRIRRVETVLQRRTDRIILLIEKSYDPHNQFACLRTAEAFGIQHVWFVDAPRINPNKKEFYQNVESAFHNIESSREYSKIARSAPMWLTVRHFKSTQDAITAVREDGRKLWVTDLSQEAKALDYNSSIKVPARFALVIGRETDGVS